MKSSQLAKILSMIKRTGDTVVALDQDTDMVLVMMPFETYEELVDEQSFNPDNMDWMEDDEELPDLDWGMEATSEIDDETRSGETAVRRVEPTPPAESFALPDEPASVVHFPKGPEESLADIPHEEEEEKFYLEPIE